MNRRNFISSLICAAAVPRFLSMLPKHVIEMHRLVVGKVTPMHHVILNPRVYDIFAKYKLISKGRLTLLDGGSTTVVRATDIDKLVRIIGG